MTQIGAILPSLAAALTLVAMIGFWRLHRGQESARRWARFCFYAACGLMQVTAALLLNAILTHRFDLQYVFGHSSTDLPYVYLISTFWAGQEGTFTLWALFGCLIGLALCARSREWEGTVMAVWCAVCLLVHGMLAASPPFAATDLSSFSDIERSFITGTCGGVPPEGQGLNPLLQNPWMAIHPPILFLGFALMAVPFCFAVAALLRRDPDGWAPRCQGWALLGFGVLGGGLILGGYWAYETLGWGGYWAWDPVENSSLVPWLFSGALFHGLILQRATRGSLRRLNLVLAGLCFVSVSYGSYLNRSGVLSDFSVHSFVALSEGFNRALLTFAVAPALLFLVAWFIGRPVLARVELETGTLSRKQLLHWVVLLLGGSAMLVLIGNSWPLLSHLFSLTPGLNKVVGEASSLQPSFYNQTHTPLAMVLAAMLSLALLTGWDSLRRETVAAGLKLPLIIAGVAAGLTAALLRLYLVGRADTPDWMPASAAPLVLAWGTLIVLFSLAAAVNGRIFWLEWRRGERWTLGTHLAHFGFSLMIIGITISSVYETKTMIELPRDEPKTFLGYELTYGGLTPVGPIAEVSLTARRGERMDLLKPILRPTRDGVVWNPGILKTLSHDLYLEPGEVRPAAGPEALPLEMTQPLEFGGLTFEFGRFDLGSHHTEMDPLNFGVGVELRVTRDGRRSTVTPRFEIRDGEPNPVPADLPGGGQVRVTAIPEKEDGSGERFLLLQLSGGEFGGQAETLVVQATLKPLMSVVWLGCWLIIVGALLAAARRAREAVRRR